MRLGYPLVAALAVAVTIFALQNTEPTIVRFVVWSVESVPLAAIVLCALGAGLLVAGLPLGIRLQVWRARARALGARVATLEAEARAPDRRAPRVSA